VPKDMTVVADPFEGLISSKEGYTAYKLYLPEGKKYWPTIDLEPGLSESLQRLGVDALMQDRGLRILVVMWNSSLSSPPRGVRAPFSFVMGCFLVFHLLSSLRSRHSYESRYTSEEIEPSRT